MANPVKIFEMKGAGFAGGLSSQREYPIGGNFQIATFNPFTKYGYVAGVPTNTQIDGATITGLVNYMVSTNSGAEGYVYGITDSLVDKTKSFYRIKVSDNTVTDYSDQIDQNSSSPITHNGITFYKGRVIYEQGGSMRSNLLTPVTGSDTNILTSASSGFSDSKLAFCIGHDGYLYYTASNSIGKIVTVNATTSNTATAFSFTDTSLRPKDITQDGVYTIFIADNNTSKSDYANSSCRIFFWDGIKTKADVIYDIPDRYLISCKYVDGKVLIIGASGIWSCNVSISPKLIFPLLSNRLPLAANSVTTQDNIMYWVANQISAKVYGYGSRFGKPILFNPFILSSSTNYPLSFIASGNYFFGSIDATGSAAKVYVHDTQGTGISSTLQTCPSILDNTFKFEYAKVVLSTPLSASQTVALGIFNGNGQVIMDTTTKTYGTVGAKQTLIFNPKSTASSFSQFEDLYISLTCQGAVPQRIAVYGTPIDDNSQII